MEKNPPPPYNAEGSNPPLGFNVPPNQVPLQRQPQSCNSPAGYPQVSTFHPQGLTGFLNDPIRFLEGRPGQPQSTYVPPGGTTVVVANVPVMSQFGKHPQPTACPHCHQQVTSKIRMEAGLKTHLIALALCLIGCIPCCLIPYCVDTCNDAKHYCPSCSAYLGNDSSNPFN